MEMLETLVGETEMRAESRTREERVCRLMAATMFGVVVSSGFLRWCNGLLPS